MLFRKLVPGEDLIIIDLLRVRAVNIHRVSVAVESHIFKDGFVSFAIVFYFSSRLRLICFKIVMNIC